VPFITNYLITKTNAITVEEMDTGKKTVVARHVASLEKKHSLREKGETRREGEKRKKKIRRE